MKGEWFADRKEGCGRLGKFENTNSTEMFCICQSNITLICLLFQLPISAVDSINRMEAPNERVRSVYMYCWKDGLILWVNFIASLPIRKGRVNFIQPEVVNAVGRTYAETVVCLNSIPIIAVTLDN